MNQSTAMRTLGLDLGDKFTHFALVDDSQEVLEEGRVATTSSELLRLLHRLDATRTVFEASTHSPWIDRTFRREGVEVVVVNPNRLKAVSDSIRKTDRNDARLLAQLGQSKMLLWEVHHRGEGAQRGLQLLMARDKVVSSRTMLINQVRGHAKSLGDPLPTIDAYRFHSLREDVLADHPDMEPLFDCIEQLSTSVKEYDAKLIELAKAHPVACRLMTVPGVGPVTALAYVYVLDDPTRFGRSRQVGPYLGLTPRLDQSGQLNKELRITKAGNSFLRKLLVGSALRFLRKDAKPSALRDWGQTYIERGGKASRKRAAVAIARKLAVCMHAIWVSGGTWDAYPDNGPFIHK